MSSNIIGSFLWVAPRRNHRDKSIFIAHCHSAWGPGETIILNPRICFSARQIDVRWLKGANLNRYNCCSQPWLWEISSAAKTNLFETERFGMALPRKLPRRFRLSRYVSENVLFGASNLTVGRSARVVFFWILFARDNVYKPQSEARSAVTAAKIDHWHKSQRLNTHWSPLFFDSL